MDGATSGAWRDSKRIGSQLAEVRSSQQERRQRTMAHAPRLPTPPSRYARSLSDHVDPPRRRGRLKMRPRRISQAGSRKSTHQAIRSRRGHIGRVGYVVYAVQGPGMVQERPRAAKHEDEATGVDRGRPRTPGAAREISRAVTCHIGQSLERSAPLLPRVGKIPFLIRQFNS